VLKWPDQKTVDREVRAWIVQEASRHPELLQAGYFGSYARGDWGVGSDLDLIIIISSADKPLNDRPLGWDLSPLPVPAELLVYTLKEWEQLQQTGGRWGKTLATETVWIYPA
jgi:hypothetical protein